MNDKNNRLYRKLPSVGEIVEDAQSATFVTQFSREFVTEVTRKVLARLRQEVSVGGHDVESIERALAGIFVAVREELNTLTRPPLRRVINATGIALQTNLGRAPLSQAAIAAITEVARDYCNLELDLETGERSRRDVHVEALILRVLSARIGGSIDTLQQTHAAAVVNNCAAATFLGLNTLAERGEVVVSRGELVEIGGGFRIPDILRKAGAVLREVGTTNRTRVSDYAAAITPETRLILRVHQSNFRIEGFTERPSLAELKELSVRTGIPLFDDQGTGSLVSLEAYGLRNEGSWIQSIRGGPDLVAASGDKLFGGPQCGILVGPRSVIDQVRANPLFRALRVDKLTYAALGATLLAYLNGQEETIPVLAMLRIPATEIRARCERLADTLRSQVVSAEVIQTRSLIGGGTTPGASISSFAVALRHAARSEDALAASLRRLDPPVMTRINQGCVVLDLRTVPAQDDAALQGLLRDALGDFVANGTGETP